MSIGVVKPPGNLDAYASLLTEISTDTAYVAIPQCWQGGALRDPTIALQVPSSVHTLMPNRDRRSAGTAEHRPSLAHVDHNRLSVVLVNAPGDVLGAKISKRIGLLSIFDEQLVEVVQYK